MAFCTGPTSVGEDAITLRILAPLAHFRLAAALVLIGNRVGREPRRSAKQGMKIGSVGRTPSAMMCRPFQISSPGLLCAISIVRCSLTAA